MQAAKQMGNKDTVEIIKKWQDTQPEQTLHRPNEDINTSTSENLVPLPEPTHDTPGGTERMIEIVKRQNLEDFKTLEKKLSTSAVSVLHIVAVYGCSEMVE
ncbi:hypothetical protein KP79_PYT01395 [Mizuhopecten yessoensis]|uniref:Uncharacterized protein n=1 Tax=Mizuhopecten yessoensis TaxID=6573 RepID=A0A210QCX3_MIZYE|nr:hypothetical protein KP79_PYT01395 [Mizuhopecten yessoensis]